MGQSLDTFSGGELQRLKIAKIIHQTTDNLLILDEPSTGLHEADVMNLLSLFKKLLKENKTLIVLEHNLKIISQAQWIIDMGLGGGNLGGNVLFQGYPIDLLEATGSYTAENVVAETLENEIIINRNNVVQNSTLNIFFVVSLLALIKFFT